MICAQARCENLRPTAAPSRRSAWFWRGDRAVHPRPRRPHPRPV